MRNPVCQILSFEATSPISPKMTVKKSQKPSGIITAYLFVYNLAQAIGWSVIWYKMVQSYMKTGSHKEMFGAVQDFLEVFQTAALLEVVHAMLGFVRSNPMLVLTQIISRVYITWHVHYAVTAQTSLAPALFLPAWTITEIIRYSFYTINLITTPPYFLQWCRYTFFIVLYPMGVSGELLAVYMSLPYIQKTGLFSVEMPNIVNMSFNYYYVCIMIMLSYIPNFPPLYVHMLSLRKKVIGGVDPKKTT